MSQTATILVIDDEPHEIDDALERAMQVFWAKGYEATERVDVETGVGSGRHAVDRDPEAHRRDSQ